MSAGLSGASNLPRVCPECGCDRYAARRLERERQEAARLRRAADTIAIDYGRMRLEVERWKHEVATVRGQLQAKIARQSKAITRLENRLREAGVKPHEGVELDQAVGGADEERPPGRPTTPGAAFL